MAHLTLYHATLESNVDSIKAKIQLDRAQPRTDFNREKKSFYLIDSVESARIMAEEVRAFSGGKAAAILKFTLNTTGLDIKTFSRELSGPSLDEWRRYVGYCRQFRTPDHVDPIAQHGYDVIVGWMSTYKNKQWQPIDTQIWQYAILTEKAAAALTYEGTVN